MKPKSLIPRDNMPLTLERKYSDKRNPFTNFLRIK